MNVDIRTETPQRDALAEGRRIYLGNLLYSVSPADVEDLLKQTGFADQFEKLHISVDPISGRNPGYCFVEFVTRDEAERALESLPGTPLFGRAVKVGPCHPKGSSSSSSSGPRWGSSSRGSSDYNPTFQRWGDWKGASAPGASEEKSGPHAAMRHLERRNRAPEGTQLYIGGLGKMIDQPTHDAEIQELLAGFEFLTVGKRITPHPDTRQIPGNHHYCFVDFSSAEEAERAVNELNGRAMPDGGRLRVSLARSKRTPAADPETNSWHSERASAATGSEGRQARAGPEAERGANAPPQQDEQARREERREQAERQRAIMASNNWRRGG